MTVYCKNCGHEQLQGKLCEVCGDNTSQKGPVAEPVSAQDSVPEADGASEPEHEEEDLDLNGDGEVDGKDASLAGKVLRSVSKGKVKSKGKK